MLRDRFASARCTCRSSRIVRPGIIPISGPPAMPGIRDASPAVRRRAQAPLSLRAWCLRRSDPIPAARSGCRIRGVIAGPDPLDPTTLGAPPWNAKRTRASPKGLKIGVPTRFYVEDLAPDIAAALDASIATLRKLGTTSPKIERLDEAVVSAAALIVLAVEATSAHAPWLRTRAADYGPQVRNRLQNGLASSALECREALRWRGPALAAHLDPIGDVDVVIAPVSRSVAPTISATDLGGVAGAEGAIQAITRLMRPTNFLGLPSLVVPARQSQSGLPIGMQLIGRPFGDEALIALGRAFQAATDHHRRVPALQ